MLYMEMCVTKGIPIDMDISEVFKCHLLDDFSMRVTKII